MKTISTFPLRPKQILAFLVLHTEKQSKQVLKNGKRSLYLNFAFLSNYNLGR
jgi:hypothetical protein